MKRKRLTAFAMAAMLGISAVQPIWAKEEGWQEKNPLVAHALGEADGKIETLSREAFISSWENGYRVVEADFTYTSDGVLVVCHDFEADGTYYRWELRPKNGLVMDSSTFKENKTVYTQTPMTAAELLSLLAEYPDMYLVTDTKNTDKATVQKQFGDLKNIAKNMGNEEILDRIIPQIYHKEMLGWVKEVHPFQDWIFTLYLVSDPNYQDIANFCKANGIGTVTLQTDRATKANVSTLKARGLKVYAHTVNRYLIFEDLLKNGVDGIYTDRIKPYELGWVGLENGRKTGEQTVTVGEDTANLTTLDIFGKAYAPLRQMGRLGKGFTGVFNAQDKTLNLLTGRSFQTLGNEMFLDDSGRLITKKADFKTLVNGKASSIQCFYVDGEVYGPVEDILALVQKK